jgi:hypothetical protein
LCLGKRKGKYIIVIVIVIFYFFVAGKVTGVWLEAVWTEAAGGSELFGPKTGAL